MEKDREWWAEEIDFYGRIRAHEAAANGDLPEGFDQWDIADETGWTVAHVAAVHGRLPKNFDKWDLKDKSDVTVRQVYDARKKRTGVARD